LCHHVVRYQRRLDLHGAEAVTRDIDHVVDAAHDPEVAVVVAPGAVTGEVDVLDLAPVLVAVAVIVAVHGAQHAWPRTAHDEVAALASRDFVAVGVDHSGVDAEHRDASRAGLTGVDTR